MERKHLIIQRSREIFGDGLNDLLQVVRQDRQELRGWEEPAHLRAVLRRAEQEKASLSANSTQVAVAEPEVGHCAAEPEKGEQREALGQILEAGAAAIEKLLAAPTPDLTPENLFGLESVLLLYGRPALLVKRGKLAEAPALWSVLEDQREDIELTAQGVGRIELVGHPEFDWAGTGFLVSDTCLMTTRCVAEIFAERVNGAWQFKPGISAWMNYCADHQRMGSAAYRVNRILGVHEHYDLALLEVEPPQQNGKMPTPLTLAADGPTSLIGRPVYLVGYPVRDSRRNEPESIARVFRDVYNVKRVHPGVLRGIESFRDIHLLRHDCAPLGDMEGACLVDMETHQVLGLHISGRYLENGVAAPLWMLQGDPLLEQCQVTLAKSTASELTMVSGQLERLARTRRWPELRSAVSQMYEQAFGKDAPQG